MIILILSFFLFSKNSSHDFYLTQNEPNRSPAVVPNEQQRKTSNFLDLSNLQSGGDKLQAGGKKILNTAADKEYISEGLSFATGIGIEVASSVLLTAGLVALGVNPVGLGVLAIGLAATGISTLGSLALEKTQIFQSVNDYFKSEEKINSSSIKQENKIQAHYFEPEEDFVVQKTFKGDGCSFVHTVIHQADMTITVFCADKDYKKCLKS